MRHHDRALEVVEYLGYEAADALFDFTDPGWLGRWVAAHDDPTLELPWSSRAAYARPSGVSSGSTSSARWTPSAGSARRPRSWPRTACR
jgi:hypothetical protein